MSKRPYSRPEIHKYKSLAELPSRFQAAAHELLIDAGPLTTIVDKQRRFVSVSESFAKALGYRTMDFIGRKLDDFTAPNSVDIDFVFGAFLKIGEMDGVWIFMHREGHRVVVHYRARLSEEYSYADIQPLLVA